ncbi:MAG: hypothetical protein WDO18_12830 [Acidobacteriota bacterium]
MLRLVDPQGFGIHGVLALNARVTGPPQDLKIDGKIDLGDIHRWDLLPDGQSITLPVTGSLNLRAETLELATANAPAFKMNVHVRHYLSQPELDATASLQEMPVESWMQTARHMGVTLPEKLIVEGTVSGTVEYTSASGLAGAFAVSESTFKMPDPPDVVASGATLAFKEGAVSLTPTKIAAGSEGVANVEGSTTLTYPRTLELRVTSRGIDAQVMKTFGLPPLPLPGGATTGTWRGVVRLRDGEWVGDTPVKLPK